MKLLNFLTIVNGIVLCMASKGFCGIHSHSSRYPTHIVDDELARVVSRPNRWGYSVRPYFYPQLSENGLTFWIQASVGLNSVRFTSVDDVEHLYVDIYRDFLRSLNSIRMLRPYMASFPLTPESCWLTLSFDDCNGDPLHLPYIASAILNHEIINFMQYQGFDGDNMSLYKSVCERSAREIQGLKELYTPICPRSSPDSQPRLPKYIQNPGRHISALSSEKVSFIEEFCRQNNLAIIIFGEVGRHYFDSRAFQFALRGSQPLSLEQAKSLAARCNKELLSFTQTNQLYKDYIKERSTWRNEKHLSPTPVPEQLAYRISFWDENIDRPVAPYIAEIRLLDGRLSYFTADENQQLDLVSEESFADSLTEVPSVKKSGTGDGSSE